jgi:hypothetical protein
MNLTETLIIAGRWVISKKISQFLKNIGSPVGYVSAAGMSYS